MPGIAKYRRKVRIPSMADVLRQPQNVWEIVEFGLDREEYAVQAVAETFVQLQQQTTHPVLVVVDAWNECFPCSEYVAWKMVTWKFQGSEKTWSIGFFGTKTPQKAAVQLRSLSATTTRVLTATSLAFICPCPEHCIGGMATSSAADWSFMPQVGRRPSDATTDQSFWGSRTMKSAQCEISHSFLVIWAYRWIQIHRGTM